MNSITIFTPTHNRKKVLERLYTSLKKQTNKQFIWLVIDDGSTDNTETVVRQWIAEKKIEIKYVKQKNVGKSMSHNRAVRMTDTELFVCLDSNDYIAKNTIEIILACWERIKNNTKIIGIISPKKAQFKDIKKRLNARLLPRYIKIRHDKKPYEKSFGDNYYIEKEKITKEYVRSTLKEAYRKYGLKGEAMLILRTSVLSKYEFPDIKGEKFVPEAYLYDLIEKNGNFAVLDRILCLHRYQLEGYTFNMSKLIKENPKGYLIYIRQRLNDDTDSKIRFFNYIRYISVAKIIKEKNVIKRADDKLIALIAYPFGVLFYLMRYQWTK